MCREVVQEQWWGSVDAFSPGLQRRCIQPALQREARQAFQYVNRPDLHAITCVLCLLAAHKAREYIHL